MRHPWLSAGFQLSYPVTRVYPWRYFTVITAGMSLVVLTVMTLINVVATGYDNITILSQDYHIAPEYWWSPLSIYHTPSCQPHQFLIGDAFSTNLSLFQYTLLAVEQSPQGRQVLQTYGFYYSGVQLSMICENPLSPDSFSVTVNRLLKTVQSKVLIICFDEALEAEVLAFEMSWMTTLLSDDVSYISSNPDNRTVAVIENALDVLAGDLLVGIVAASANSSVAIDSFVAGGRTYCPEFETANGSWAQSPSAAQAAQCNNASVALYSLPLRVAYSNDTVLSTSEVPAALNQSIANYLQVLNAAVLADIGVWYPNNVFTSMEMFNATIASNVAVDAAIAGNPALSSLGMVDGLTTSAATQLRKTGATLGSLTTGIPLAIPLSSQTPAIIALSYLCQVQRIKSPLNFIISVVVADASMFTAFYAFWALLASALARRKSGDANVCEGHLRRDSFSMKSRTTVVDETVAIAAPAYRDEWER